MTNANTSGAGTQQAFAGAAIHRHVADGFSTAASGLTGSGRRLGAELKFPLINEDGTAASYETVCALWEHLRQQGWKPAHDSVSGHVVGARTPGELNDTVASCETGYCKTEFSLAHVADLFALAESLGRLRKELAPFAEEHDVRFLGYGIQPVTRPGKELLMKKMRASFWDRAFPSNRHISREEGDDVHLFTINAASHVHVSVAPEEAVRAVNVLNGFSPAQIALTAHSNIWKGRVDPEYVCVAEKMWDWWMPDSGRVGIPPRPFTDLEDYVCYVSGLSPVYVKRNGKPILLPEYATFREYFGSATACGHDLEGNVRELTPSTEDFDVHSTCYWFNARLSRYYTIENRVNDQQPPEDAICISALTLGLVSALCEAEEELSSYEWAELRAARDAACRDALRAEAGGFNLCDLAGRMLEIARTGLLKRGMGEEVFLEPLQERLVRRRCPADDAEDYFTEGGIEKLVSELAL